MDVLKVKFISEYARLPTRGSEKAAGYDLYSAHDSSIPAWDKQLISTDIAIALPDGYYGRIAPRSGLAVKHGIHVGGGVIDPDYTGTIKVLLFNLSDQEFTVNRGDRIAQLILEKFITVPVIQVYELDPTIRGLGGFGSTGFGLDRFPLGLK